MKKMTIDGNTAASHVAYALSEVAAIYPITPSSPMAEYADEWSADGRQNIFGQNLKVAQMQSEAGAAGAVHGSLIAGALTTTYTASQGLLLMIPNMYKIAGELLPAVFHVSARALAAHALSIFGDHADVMACRQTGFAMLASNSVQEAMDLALVSHLSALKTKVPFLHFFDGFRTSHEVSKIDAIEYDEIKQLAKKLDLYSDINEFKNRALNPEHPHQKGTAQNPDIYFQNRERANKYYSQAPEIVQKMMDEVSSLTGRKYELFQYYGDKNAESIIIMMGSGAETVEETIDYLNSKGQKLGLLKVRLYRPFSVKHFINSIPKSVKKIAVLDRTKESGSLGEPLYLDVISALNESGIKDITVVGGRYGLGSKEFNPTMVNAIYKNLNSKEIKNHFTVGINDDVSFTSLKADEFINASPVGTSRCKFYGLGSDGTVGANKNSIKIIGDHTDMNAQGYFVYDSKKSGGITISHLRFGKKPIKSTYLIDEADFAACHNQSYVTRYDMTSSIKNGGVFLLNCNWSIEQLDKELPAQMKRDIANKKLRFYIIDGLKIAQSVGLGGRINGVMQAAFFKLADIIPYDEAEKYMKEAVEKSYGRKGEKIVKMNRDAIDNAISGLIEVNYPESWKNADSGASKVCNSKDKYYNEFILPILAQEGDNLPVSAFNEDGSVPTSTTRYEKRGIAANLPCWESENCIQCNQCVLVCPHACIRPVILNEEEAKNAPFISKAMQGMPEYKYKIQLSPLDCTGCGSCANVCPSKQKALVMKPADEITNTENVNYEYSLKVSEKDVSEKFKTSSVKGSQFLTPLFEFSGACAGCGETPYIKLITQLYGDRMIVANATGCSSIYGGSAPTCPYTVNKNGHGPAWANSLFEDNAEFGYGMNLAYSARRSKLISDMQKAIEGGVSNQLAQTLADYIKDNKNAQKTKELQPVIVDLVEKELKGAKGEVKEHLSNILDAKDCIIKKSIWIIGGDGWSYDIGFGGLDHVLASGEDVNILVLDTEVYSNTGGQSSKATPTGSTAKFASSGKRIKKKDLGMMAVSYGYVYVAQVAMGANQQQLLNAITEAESYDGPSLIIAYSTCINHGIDMSKGQLETKKAVEAGYWQLFRYNPVLKEQGKNPFTLDSKEPSADYKDFLLSEVRYKTLSISHPELASDLFKKSEEDAKERLETYKSIAKN